MALIIVSAEQSPALGTSDTLSSRSSNTKAKAWLGSGVTAVSLMSTMSGTQASPGNYAFMEQWQERHRQAENFYNTALLIALVVSVTAVIVIAICFRKWRKEVAALKKLEGDLAQTKSTTC